MDSVLSVQEVHKTFHIGVRRRTSAVLRGVTFEVPRGEIFGFLGPNGAGKTTTIKAICDLVTPDRGRIEVLGGRFADPRVRLAVGFMPEQAYYHEYLTAAEFLRLHGRLCGLSGQALDRRGTELLGLVGLGSVGSKTLRTFSKGMLQRVGLAQALLANPTLLILDEPLSGLDPIGRRDLRDILLAQKERGVTIFFSTHILPDVELICDRVAILNAGRTVLTGAIAELSAGAASRYDLEVSMTGEGLEALRALAQESRLGPARQRFAVPAAEVYRAVELVRAHQGQILRLEAQHTSLEDAFVRALATSEGGVPCA